MTSYEIKNDPYPNCTIGRQELRACSYNCRSCGFDKNEAARRSKLPLVMGEDGLKRKYIRRG